jgi:bifunctional DNA-binding transcriptional regulator/antitoxin component of YhaV-PrlF toxin-antitoxin module
MFGIKKGTRVFIYEKGGEIVVKPITDEYIESMAGVTGTKGKLLEALKEEKGVPIVMPAFRALDAYSLIAFYLKKLP